MWRQMGITGSVYIMYSALPSREIIPERDVCECVRDDEKGKSMRGWFRVVHIQDCNSSSMQRKRKGPDWEHAALVRAILLSEVLRGEDGSTRDQAGSVPE